MAVYNVLQSAELYRLKHSIRHSMLKFKEALTEVWNKWLESFQRIVLHRQFPKKEEIIAVKIQIDTLQWTKYDVWKQMFGFIKRIKKKNSVNMRIY